MGNNRGSALAWALCLMLVLSVTLAGMAGIASAYQRRGLREIERNRAYLAASAAARSAVLVLDGASVGVSGLTAGQIEQKIASELPLLPLETGGKTALEDFELGAVTYDELTASVERLSPELWRVSARAVCGAAEYELGAIVELSRGAERYVWSFVRYE